MSRLSDDFFSMEDIYLAYRKAKVDVFFERSQPMAEAFCDYEKNLHDNLTALSKKLRAKKPAWFNDLSFIGGFGFIPKGLKTPVIKSTGEPHFSLSDPEDAWKLLLKQCGEDRPSVEFRPVAHFTVDMYVICALWVNHVGHKYDACLDASARGSRLRRLRSAKESGDSSPAFHQQAPGSFKPYFYCYREWREGGLKAIRHELTEGRRVVAVTMDLTAFYHNVDPRFLLNDGFLTKCRFESVNRARLSEDERAFTEHLVSAFETWAGQLPHVVGSGPPGVPVGPSAPRVIANVLLGEFDRLVQRQLAPIYYGRYVDDIFLVLRDTGAFKDAGKVITHLARRIKPLTLNDDCTELRLNLPYAEKSQLIFKTEKQRVFLLSGEIGEDLLDAIESKIDEVSSEWRLLPNLDDLERSPAARVLTAARQSNEDVDSLRKADELSLRRLGFALMLRSVDALARDLPPKEWVAERKRFYRFATRHVLTPLRFLDLNDYLPRLLGLAVACRDWSEAHGIVSRIASVVKALRAKVTVVPLAGAHVQWDGYLRHLARSLHEAVVSSYPVDATVHSSNVAAKRILEKIESISQEMLFSDATVFSEAAACSTSARDLFWSDLSRVPFKESLLEGLQLPVTDRSFEEVTLPDLQAQRAAEIRQFLSGVGKPIAYLIPLLFPTRPLNAAEVTECLPDTAEDLELLRKYVQALRGTWVRLPANGEEHDKQEGFIEIGYVRDSQGQDRSDELSH